MIKTEGGLGDNTYKGVYPTDTGPPKFYGLPKIHKETPLSPQFTAEVQLHMCFIWLRWQGVGQQLEATGRAFLTFH